MPHIYAPGLHSRWARKPYFGRRKARNKYFKNYSDFFSCPVNFTSRPSGASSCVMLELPIHLRIRKRPSVMANIAKLPCDEGAILAAGADRSDSGRGVWVLAATILGS